MPVIIHLPDIFRIVNIKGGEDLDGKVIRVIEKPDSDEDIEVKLEPVADDEEG